MEGPALILSTTLHKPPFTPRPSTPAAVLLRKRSAPDDDVAEVDAPSARRVRTPSKRKRLEEEVLVLESATDVMEDEGLIGIG